jgi:hypothetical protein
VADSAYGLGIGVVRDQVSAVALDAAGDAGETALSQMVVETSHLLGEGIRMAVGAVDARQAFGMWKFLDALQGGMAIGASKS